jgi:hypothetical protein
LAEAVTVYKAATLAFLILMSIIVLVNIWRGKHGMTPHIRKIPALDAIEEGVGRAAEMNRPIHGSAGTFPLDGAYGSLTVVGLSLLNYTARLAARHNAKAFFTNMESINQPALMDAIRSAYVAEGKPELFTPDTVRFVVQDKIDAMAYGAAMGDIFDRERPALNLMVGGWTYETLMVVQSANRVGAVTIGGEARVTRLPDFVAGADYVLLGEEMMTAGAYVSKEPVALSSILSQDWIRYILIALVLGGTFLNLLGNQWLYQILGT